MARLRQAWCVLFEHKMRWTPLAGSPGSEQLSCKRCGELVRFRRIGDE
jgi:hypothetical protein